MLTQLPERLFDSLRSEPDRAVAVPTLRDCSQDNSHCLERRGGREGGEGGEGRGEGRKRE